MRMGLANWLLPISRNQFIQLGQEFRNAVEADFGCQVDVQVDLYSAPKRYISIIDDDAQAAIDEHNQSLHQDRLTKISGISSEIWKRAGFIEVAMRPVDPPASLPSYAFAHMEAKGCNPSQVTFYVQPDGKALDVLGSKHPFMRQTDGMESNGDNQTMLHAGRWLFGLGR